MKKIQVRPERCVGCMQCMLGCAVVHSESGSLMSATLESPVPKPRVHVGSGIRGEGFPNLCRHCNPAPCMLACLPGAIYRVEAGETVLINSDMCINCGTCAMACPFGVLRFHEDLSAPPGKTVALKCDNCLGRREQGLPPACVEACKTEALTLEDTEAAMKRKTDEVARRVLLGVESEGLPQGVALLKSIKCAEANLGQD